MQTKIIVLDDDPTGSQTVHSCLLLTRWDVATLKLGLNDASPLMFILTNTRGMNAQAAASVTREVCENLEHALQDYPHPVLYVSRSDSTLRGHYPVETDVMEQTLGPFDALFLIPAFFEGGRFTRDGVHYVRMGEREIPAHETEFARDSVFGYANSYLPAYIEEKTQGRIRAGDVLRFTRAAIEEGTRDRLLQLEGRTTCVVDAEEQADLNRFAQDVLAAVNLGKRFLFRSAASWLTALAQLPPQPVAADQMHRYVRSGRAGAIVVGSHVKKTTEQLQQLFLQTDIEPLEVDVSRLPQNREALLARIVAGVALAHAAGKTPVIYTSRQEKSFPDTASRLQFGELVSTLLMDIVRELPSSVGFIISKGGITSNDVLSRGLAMPATRIVGQILAGCSVVLTPADHPRFPEIPVVIFPGNVGDEQALATVYNRLRGL